MLINKYITSSDSLVTSHDEIRSGFLSIALEKNRVGDPYVKTALTFKAMVSGTKNAEELLEIKEVRPFLVTASGLSEKALTHLSEDDCILAIKELIDKFLKPAGNNYIDEATFRYLLIKGDAVGGTMRNRIGAMGQEKLVRAIFSSMSVQNISCDILHTSSKDWRPGKIDEADIEKEIKAIKWKNKNGNRVVIFNATVPTVKKNIDICLYSYSVNDTLQVTEKIKDDKSAIMYGELKGGIDPAGADEHWKTANSVLNRIRDSYKKAGYANIKTAFVGAAIEKAMAEEIYSQLSDDIMTNATNLTNTNQLTDFCNWLISL